MFTLDSFAGIAPWCLIDLMNHWAATAPSPCSRTGMFFQGWQPALTPGAAPGLQGGAALSWHVACLEESCWHHQNCLHLHTGGRRCNSRRCERHRRMGERMIFCKSQIKCFVSSPEPETDRFEETLGIWGCRPEYSWDSSWAAVLCLGTTIVLSQELQNTACVWGGRMMLPLLWSTEYPHVPTLQWELRALSTLLAVIITSWLGPWTIKAFRYPHREVMKSCKHEVLILTTVMKCDYWSIYFHL